MKTITRILLAAATVAVIVCPLSADEQAQRYIVVLKQRSGAVPDMASLGGKIEFRQDDQLVVTIPPAALAALKADPAVRYIERVGGMPADDDAPLIGVPSDPQPGPTSHAARFTPHALGNLAWDSGTYQYDGAGNIVTIGSDNYLYDGVQRLKQSSTRGTVETYTYDGFGNVTAKTNNNQSQMIPTVETATNRYIGTGYFYNAVGAMTSDGSYIFSYDALGQPVSKIYNNNSSTLEYYIYTPGDERIGVQRSGWWTWSVRDEGGKVLRQYKSSATNPSAPALWLEDFVWRDGLLLGSQRPVEMGGRRHFHLDHLGTPRLITAENGQQVSSHDYYPFGDERSTIWQEGPSAGGFDREEPMKFTGHERDYAGGMGGEDGHAIDDMHARYYSPKTGRFLSVDPVLGSAGRPQSWNRYGYVEGSPLTHTDPAGLATAQTIYEPVPPSSVLYLEYAPGEKERFLSEMARLDAMIAKGELPISVKALLGAKTPSFLAAGLRQVNGFARTPDYISVSVNVAIPNQYTATLLGPTFQVTFDRYGRVYFMLAGGFGKSASQVSWGVTAGWIYQRRKPEPGQLYRFISGWGANGSYGYWGGGSQTWGGPGAGFANELGVVSPQLGVSGGYAWQLPVNGPH